jgi:F-type H+-transporting ATPase subunit a
MENELWLTALLNRFLAAPANAVLNAVRLQHDAAHPWSNWLSMELLVVAVIVVVFAILRARLSVDNPGKLQHTFELVYEFLAGQADESIEHGGAKYASFFGTIFLFILFMNLIGVVPGFESPTMTPAVPLGCAVSVVLYYHWAGLRELGPIRYLLQFAGPVWWLAPLMIPIELISHLARPLSLTVRLFGNMFAGEKITLTFLTITYLFVPALFMGLHVFVSFLQAYIFALLATIYVGGAVAHEH